jgi:DNA-binding transcriptional ArsR family regulator
MPASPPETAYRADIAPAAALLADRTRAAMLTALLDGRALAAGELAQLADVSPAAASAHLALLLDGGFVKRTRQGRHQYYRLAGHEVAAAIEALSHLGSPVPVRTLRQSRQAAALAEARTCYDHLAGRAGVALLDALLGGGVLTGAPGGTQVETGTAHLARGVAANEWAGSPAVGTYEVTEAGAATLSDFGLDVPALRRTRRRFAGPCLDWTQRRPHLNGALGAAITGRLLDLGWIERGSHRRAVRVSAVGRKGLAETFGWAAEESVP